MGMGAFGISVLRSSFFNWEPARRREEVCKLGGGHAIGLAVGCLQEQLAGSAVAGDVDNVPALGVGQYAMQQRAGDAVLQDANIGGLARLGDAADECDEGLALTAQVEGWPPSGRLNRPPT